MTPFIRPLAALALLATTTPALAQGYDDRCIRHVERICQGEMLGDCFAADAAWAKVPEFCVGDVQSLIEDERTALEQGDGGGGGATPARSTVGGNLRDGPGAGFRRVGSVAPNEAVLVIGETGEWLDGYQWYEIEWRGLRGYLWGALICVDGGAELNGANGYCG